VEPHEVDPARVLEANGEHVPRLDARVGSRRVAERDGWGKPVGAGSHPLGDPDRIDREPHAASSGLAEQGPELPRPPGDPCVERYDEARGEGPAVEPHAPPEDDGPRDLIGERHELIERVLPDLGPLKRLPAYL